MSSGAFTEADRKQLEQLGIQQTEVQRQLSILTGGQPRVHLLRPCTPGDGIDSIGAEDRRDLLSRWASAAEQGRVGKFVPASGAATRMFAFLQRARTKMGELGPEAVPERELESDSDYQNLRRFIDSLQAFPFFESLAQVMRTAGCPVDRALAAGNWAEIIDAVLESRGLGYQSLPKALIPFHRYDGEVRTPLEEHLVEAVGVVQDRARCCRVHFTVDPEIEPAVRRHGGSAAKAYGERFGVRFDQGFSPQSPASTTLAVDPQNRPFRQPDGSLLLRPGGHGALLENLNQLQGDVVIIKNIDNVVTEEQAEPVLLHLKLLVGMLLKIQDEIHRHLRSLRSDPHRADNLDTILGFVTQRLQAPPEEDFPTWSHQEKAARLAALLDRPVRVCGMVKNRGEPGGGPFWVQEPSGRVSKQIVENAQVDQSSPDQAALLRASTHFNPVLIACGLRDVHGTPFDLHRYVDPQTVIVTRKTAYGRELKALELPGLWNGGMAHWNTVFVEVPEETFNPVKTINDLLRPAHRGR
jgi:hypothetical protein